MYKEYTILVAEDDPEILEMLVKELQEISNIKMVVSATDGLEAIQKLRNQVFDLVILDYKLPKKTAIDVITTYKKDFKIHGTQVLVISGYLEPDVVKEAILLGVNKFLVKPFTDDDFMAEVAKIIELDLS